MTTECWKIDNLCGFSPERSVSFIGIFTVIISLVAMVNALVTVKDIVFENQYNSRPLRAINMVFSLYCFSISMYQIVISILLVWKRSEFFCSVWFVSHATILTLYFLMFIAKIVVCYYAEEYLVAMFTFLSAVIYEGVFIFFMIIVHSYLTIMK